MRTACLLVLALTLSPALAHADDNLALHANGGLEILGGKASSVGFRTHVGLAKSFGLGSIRPSIALGATLGSGRLSVTDRRALDGSVDVGLLTYGPEAQVDLRFADGGWIDTRVFAGIAQLHSSLDKRLMLDPIRGVVASDGLRVSVGANWADRMGSVVADHWAGYQDKQHGLDWLLLIVPQQFEIAWERSGGSDRVGIVLGYGI